MLSLVPKGWGPHLMLLVSPLEAAGVSCGGGGQWLHIRRVELAEPLCLCGQVSRPL